MVATAVNDSPFSPLSTVRRGRRICAPVVFLDGIADQEALEARARQLLSHSLYMTETVFYETEPTGSVNWPPSAARFCGKPAGN